ncbi:MAG TPA: hypothetical protein ENN30_01035, partial [Candidatus Woesearchaeota archaeon]|nr:hypothetical protein [Candidatus Woesearchaeota archaeon]
MKKTKILVAVILVTLLGFSAILLAASRQDDTDLDRNNSINTRRYTPQNEPGDPRLRELYQIPDLDFVPNGYFHVIIKGESMPEEFEEVNITVQSFAIHKSYESSWTVMSDKAKVFQLDGSPSFLVEDGNVDAFTYNNMYFYIPEVIITKNGTQYRAFMPSERFEIYGELITVFSDTPSYVLINILGNESFLTTTDGEYIFAPKIRIMAYKQARLNQQAELLSGTLWTDITVGMNKKGMVQSGFGINPDAKLRII